jgi:polyisoprenoid-binding protein YceI
MRLHATALVLALAVCGPAIAGSWQADQSSGKLEFTAVQADAKFTGRFEKFTARLDFDPAAPAGGELRVTVDVASIETGDAERDEILRSREFFWVEKHPQATYVAKRFARDGAGWRADGELSIRGVTKPAAVRFTLDESAAPAMKGGSELRRLAFGLGQGEFATTEWVGDEVEVSFELKLRPVAAAARTQ